jgi:hypothetical protein
MNKELMELSEEFDLKKSAPKKLRGICISYRNDGSSSNDDQWKKANYSKSSVDI